jgi:hypothetical protein
MSADLFGLLSLPAPLPDDGAAVTDPALDILLDFCMTVINADLGAAWGAVCAADPLPVAYVFAHDPDLEDFDTNKTPALYMWRADDNGRISHISQDLVVDEGGFNALWVPPPATFENRAARAGIRNGLKKSLTGAIGQGRHPAWIVAGDTYFQPEDYGSVLLHQLGFMKCRLGQTRAHKLIIANEDGRGDRAPFECIFFTIESQETLGKSGIPAVNATGYSALTSANHTIKLPTRNVTGLDEGATLDVLDPQFLMSVVSIDTATGPIAGGTDVEITGTQFIDGMTVAFGATQSLLVQFVDESTIIARAPGHAAGIVDITVTQAPGGVAKTLTSAFTYV